MAAAPIALNSALDLDRLLRQWMTTAPADLDTAPLITAFDAWLRTQAPPRYLPPDSVAPFRRRAGEVLLKDKVMPFLEQKLQQWKASSPNTDMELPMAVQAFRQFVSPFSFPQSDTCEQTKRVREFIPLEIFFPKYRQWADAGTFSAIDEDQLVGFLAYNSKAVDESQPAPRLHQIKCSQLPTCIVTLVNRILTIGNAVCDVGFANQAALQTAIADKLTRNRALFQTTNQYARTQSVTKVPTLTELIGTLAHASNKNTVGAIRSAHCDNNEVLGRRPMYTLTPTNGADRKNLYYLWIETLTAFDANQSVELARSGVWPALDAQRRAVARIAYVEYTAGDAHGDLRVPKARLVYDYLNNEVYLTVHYDSPNHLKFLNWLGVKPYFKIVADAAVGTDSLDAARLR